MRTIVGIIALCGLAPLASAALFDVTSAVTGTNGSAVGTSNGIGFTLVSSFIWGDRTTTNETYQGFTGDNFPVPMPNADRLHGSNMQVTFDETISSILLYITDNESDGALTFDFGIAPEILSGAFNVNGTAFGPSNSGGGMVRLNGIYSATLSSLALSDGADYAFVATPVPEPGTMGALGLSVAAMLRRKRKG